MNDLNHWQSVIADGDNVDAVYKMLPPAGMKQGSCLECGDPNIVWQTRQEILL